MALIYLSCLIINSYSLIKFALLKNAVKFEWSEYWFKFNEFTCTPQEIGMKLSCSISSFDTVFDMKPQFFI